MTWRRSQGPSSSKLVEVPDENERYFGLENVRVCRTARLRAPETLTLASEGRRNA